jgi:hypothetical protein
MTMNDTFDSEDHSLEPDPEEIPFDEKVTRTRNQLDQPLNNLMTYAVSETIEDDSEAFSYAEFSDRTPYGSTPSDVAQLIHDGFLDLEFFATERLEAGDETIDGDEIPDIGFNTVEEFYEDNLQAIEDGEQNYVENKGAMPGTEDAALTIGEAGKQYIEDTQMEYKGEQVGNALENSLDL